MWLRNMLKICLVFWKSGPQYAYKVMLIKKHVSRKLKSVTMKCSPNIKLAIEALSHKGNLTRHIQSVIYRPQSSKIRFLEMLITVNKTSQNFSGTVIVT